MREGDVSCFPPQLSTRALLRRASMYVCIYVQRPASVTASEIVMYLYSSACVRVSNRARACRRSRARAATLSRRAASAASAAQLMKRLLSNKYTVHSRHCCKYTDAHVLEPVLVLVQQQPQMPSRLNRKVSSIAAYEKRYHYTCDNAVGRHVEAEQGSCTGFVQTWDSHWSRIT